MSRHLMARDSDTGERVRGGVFAAIDIAFTFANPRTESCAPRAEHDGLGKLLAGKLGEVAAGTMPSFAHIADKASRRRWRAPCARRRSASYTKHPLTRAAGSCGKADPLAVSHALRQRHPHRDGQTGTMSGRVFGNFARISGVMLRVSITIRGGVCANQSDSETSA